MVAATKIKYYVDAPLNEIKGIGNKSHTRGQIVKKVWVHIKKEKLQGVQGDTCKYNGRTYKGGQVIFVGDDPIMKAVCANKKKIAMVELAKCMEKYLERAD
jgi:chromatin remodeling complex protein RSC6